MCLLDKLIECGIDKRIPINDGTGPEKEGWSMMTGIFPDFGHPIYTNITYCPFCGKLL